MVTRLGPTTDTGELAGMLNAAGLTTGHGRPFDAKAVQWIRHAYHLPAPDPFTDGEISVTDTAKRLTMQHRHRLRLDQDRQTLRPTRPGNRLCHFLDGAELKPMPLPGCRIWSTSTPRPAAPNPGLPA